jgi:hypothetical protein
MPGSEGELFAGWLAAKTAEHRSEEQNKILMFMMIGVED